MVEPIAVADLAAANAIVVDCRSSLEYGILHIAGATLLPVDIMTAEDLARLRPKDDATRPIVFYCNGHTCRKSNEAVVRAAAWGFVNLRCLDAGIFAWANAQPARSELCGAVLPADQLKAKRIPADRFAARCLDPAAFIAAAQADYALVIDILDAKDVQAFPLRLPRVETLPVDELRQLIEAKSSKVARRKLLIADYVGHQTKWVQYLLEQHGHTDYAFLRNGVNDGWRKDGFDSDGKKP